MLTCLHISSINSNLFIEETSVWDAENWLTQLRPPQTGTAFIKLKYKTANRTSVLI